MEDRTQLNPDFASGSFSSSGQSVQPKQCGLYLGRGISIWNFYCILVLQFAANHGYLIERSFSVLLLQDKEYYQVDIDSLAHTMANYKTIVTVIFIVLSFFGRFIYDTWSYRCLIPLAGFIAGALPYVLYSFLYIYILDWTQSLLVPIYVIASINFLIFIYLTIFVKNVNRPPQIHEVPRPNCCVRIIRSLSEAWVYSVKRKVFLLIFVLNLLNNIINQITSQSLVVYLSKYIYHGDVLKIAHHTKYLGISHLIGMLLVPLVGYLFDRFYPTLYLLAWANLFAIYYYPSFTSPLAYVIQISAQVLMNNVAGVLQHSSLALHTPPFLKAGLYSIAALLGRLGIVIYEQMSGPILDSKYALDMFFIGAVMSLALALLFFIVALCSNSVFIENSDTDHIVFVEQKDI